MTKLEMLTKIEQVRNLKVSMKGCYFWGSPGAAASRRSYEASRTIEEVEIAGIKVFAKTECSCKNIYFLSTDNNDLKLAEIKLRFGELKELRKSEAEIKFAEMENPNGYTFSQVWSNLKK